MSRAAAGRSRGRIEERGSSLRVVVYAGTDPVTGKRSYLREKVDGTDKAAQKRAEKVLNRLLTQADEQRAPSSSVTLSYALDEWMHLTEMQDSTRKTYEGYIARTIKPALGEEPAKKINARALEASTTNSAAAAHGVMASRSSRSTSPMSRTTTAKPRNAGHTSAAPWPHPQCARSTPS